MSISAFMRVSATAAPGLAATDIVNLEATAVVGGNVQLALGAGTNSTRLTGGTVRGSLSVSGTTGDDTRWGGVVGVGLEYGFAPNWSVGIEYDHLFMQDRTYTFTTTAGAFFGTDRIRQDVDLVTARVNYKFGGPTVARY